MIDFFSWLFSSRGFMPHGHCYLWQPTTLWLNAGSDALIAGAYFAIPLSLYSLVKRRVTDIPFPGIFLMFAAFILLCGATHIMEIWTIWNPVYRLGGALKLVTGIVSIATTVVLFRLMPLAMQLRSPRELRQEVEARTAELALANKTLRDNLDELQRQRQEIQRSHRERSESLALLATTLRSIGDAVISTNEVGTIQFMNTIAEALTGWREQDARERPLEEVFKIVNEQTRDVVESPVAKVLREGAIVGLANHTVLLARDGVERPIEDSGAPIWDGGELKGVVLVFRDATTQRMNERALADSEKRFRAAVDAVQGVLWTNTADGEMRGEQPGWSALTGQTFEEYQGLGWSQAVHPEDAQPTVDAWLEAVRERRLFMFEHRIRRHDGQWRRFSVRSIPIFNSDGIVHEWVGVHTDITEQREGEQALRESERQFATLANAMPQLVWTERPDGTHEYFNRGWYAYTGLSAELAVHTDVWASVIHPEDERRAAERWSRSRSTGETYEVEFRLRRHDGVYNWFLARAVADADEKGRVVQWFGTCTNIDNTKRIEQSLRKTELALREADRRKDIFLAVLSHELRNPLAPIRNAASLLGRSNLEPEILHRSHLIIRRQVQHMAALLDDLLDVSRITRGVFTLKKQYVDLRGLLNEAVETARPQVDRKQHVLHAEWPTEPVEIEADPVRIVQIISNLLTNAAKYTDPGGEIFFKATIDADRLVLSVRDTGIGIAPEMLVRVFEMFSQIEPGKDRTEGGLGVGLALVKGLVELHGGHIEARSAGVERGSEFLVSIPCLHVPTGASGQPAQSNPHADNAKKVRQILVADDNQDGAESLAMLLRMFGHDVLVAHDGPGALVMAAEHRPQIAILDIGMPGLSGYEIAMRIRQAEWGERITLIAVTGWGQEEDRRRAREAGFDHHLTKPVDINELEKLFDADPAASSAAGGLS